MRVTSTSPTSVSLYAHLSALQEERDRRHSEIEFWREKFQSERDRRYAEVDVEREKALKIKDEADRRALTLADEIQKYKDEKANNLRTQIENERGTYSTKNDLTALTKEFQATIKPLVEFVARSRGGADKWVQIALMVGLAGSIIAIFVKL